MYRKKLMAACLTGALVVSMTTTNVVPFVTGGMTVQAAEKKRREKSLQVLCMEEMK